MRGERLCTVEDDWRPWLRLYLAILRQAAIDAKCGKVGARLFLEDALEDPHLVHKALSTNRLPRFEFAQKQAGRAARRRKASETL